jgi:hypothetical protein
MGESHADPSEDDLAADHRRRDVQVLDPGRSTARMSSLTATKSASRPGVIRPRSASRPTANAEP